MSDELRALHGRVQHAADHGEELSIADAAAYSAWYEARARELVSATIARMPASLADFWRARMINAKLGFHWDTDAQTTTVDFGAARFAVFDGALFELGATEGAVVVNIDGNPVTLDLRYEDR